MSVKSLEKSRKEIAQKAQAEVADVYQVAHVCEVADVCEVSDVCEVADVC